MDRRAFCLLRQVSQREGLTQREIARSCGISLGKANNLLKSLISNGYVELINRKYKPTDNARLTLQRNRVDNAVILAAGFGSRFVPLSYVTPKGLLEVHGERMIERQIRQLQDVGVTDITVVVGYLKEKFDYLVDKFDLKIVYNPDYATRNNLSSLYHVRHLLKNTYVLSSDNYMTENLFSAYEIESWYSIVRSDGDTTEWCVRIGRDDRIKEVEVVGTSPWFMCGPVFFSRHFSDRFVPLIEEAYRQPGTESFFWEDVYKQQIASLDMYANRQSGSVVYEFDKLEQLRCFDTAYITRSGDRTMAAIASALGVTEGEIREIMPLKLGMTNSSFLFRVGDRRYICRIPGAGTEKLIDRKAEYRVYKTVASLRITDSIVMFDPDTGVKISEYMEGSRVVDPNSREDLLKSIQLVRRLHHSGLTVEHSFDLEERILFYENLCKPLGAILYEDYTTVRGRMNELLSTLSQMTIPPALCHVDLNGDNLLVLPAGDIRLIDWEYAGMCDPLLDLSMFSIYSGYDHRGIETLMSLYLEREPTPAERFRVYAYAALGGFLWAIWAEYKQALGVSFGDYTLRMYRYAKTYYSHCTHLIEGRLD